ncbi:MAG: hypothetical protein ACI4I9_09895, partial [Porcipelethomonas sp.]
MDYKKINAHINVEFSETTSRSNIESGESITTVFGKIRRWISDLKPIAFSGSYKDLSDTPDIESRLSEKSDTDHKHTRSDITDFPASMPASDVYPWAKASTKPT